MAKNREAEAAGRTRTQGKWNWLRRTFWIGVLVGAVAGCGLQWTITAHRQLIVADARRVYHAAQPYVSRIHGDQIARWYKNVSSPLRGLHDSYQVAAVSNVACSATTPRPMVRRVLGLASQTPGPVARVPSECSAAQLLPVRTLAVTHAAITSANPAPQTDTIQLVGSNAVAPASDPTPPPATPQLPPPASLVALSDRADCSQGVTLNVVAHEDDDLLFLTPDLSNDIMAGRCVRTIYLTAGDAGQPSEYWTGREQGSQAAYAAMYGLPDVWHEEYQQLDGRLVAVSYLDGAPQIALVFLRLPDGNLKGAGFAATNNESLQKLLSGQIPVLHTIDNGVAYSQDQLVDSLADIMRTDATDTIRTQDPNGFSAGDHADHAAAGTLASSASAAYEQLHLLVTYLGYPDQVSATNLTAEQITSKESVFMTYAKHDDAVCQTLAECALTTTYGSFLTRQYKLSEVVSGQSAPPEADLPAITY